MLMEITPLCDFQNGHMKVAKLVAGLAVPPDKEKLLKKQAAFMRVLQVAQFPEPLDGAFITAWNARYIVSAPLAKLSKCNPVCRLRQQPLVDMQAWLAGHAARPGYLAVR